jgi:hypothetical protein
LFRNYSGLFRNSPKWPHFLAALVPDVFGCHGLGRVPGSAWARRIPSPTPDSVAARAQIAKLEFFLLDACRRNHSAACANRRSSKSSPTRTLRPSSWYFEPPAQGLGRLV